AGILILEGYGMTENAAGATVNHPDGYKIGTVGQPFPGSEVRIATDGEVQLKGPHVMAGYHNLPEATAEAFTEDGWLRTGDKGEIDPTGYLRITGRIKELFKTSGGKYIAPTAIEGTFKAINPYASQFLVHGAERNFCVALIALDPEAIAGWAEHNGHGGKSYADLVTSSEVREMLQKDVDELNGRLNRWETIKKFIVLDHDLSIESGELTPSLKVKRKVVEENNKEQINALYS
ncbi:MAG TPA: AMP-binding protein, partial [Nocardioidaceae bacterium]|nr:AMP-binding protein [Nocardioidaceae bacterium]